MTTANGHSRNATAVSVATCRYISVKCALDYTQALIRDIIINLGGVRSRDPQPHPSVLPSETTSEKRRRGEFSKLSEGFLTTLLSKVA